MKGDFAGRPPTPTRILETRGTYRKDRHGHRSKLKSNVPSCPKWLAKEAKAEWKRCVDFLKQIDVIVAIDRALIAAYCMAWAEYKECEEMIAKSGPVIKGSVGSLVVNPYVRIKESAAIRMLKLASQLGITPVARCRLQGSNQQDEDDAFQEFLRTGKVSEN